MTFGYFYIDGGNKAHIECDIEAAEKFFDMVAADRLAKFDKGVSGVKILADCSDINDICLAIVRAKRGVSNE